MKHATATHLVAVVGEPGLMTRDTCISLLPLGRHTRLISGAAFRLEGVDVLGVFEPSRTTVLGRGALVVLVDERDEASYAEIERAMRPWQERSSPVIVIVAGDDNRYVGARVARIAVRWHACVLRVDAESASVRRAMQTLVRPLVTTGLVGIDVADFARVFRAPAWGCCLTAPYQPATRWTLPPAWVWHLVDVERVLVVKECTPSTSLFEINELCRDLNSRVPPDAEVLLGCPVVTETEGSVTIVPIATAPGAA